MELAPDFDEFVGSLIARGVEFVVVGAVEGPLGTHRVEFLGRGTFLRNKRAAGRPRDLADIVALNLGGAAERTGTAAAFDSFPVGHLK